MKTLLTALFLATVNILFAQSWYQVSVPTSKNLNDIDFPSSTVGYIVGDSATLLKTTDGGENWSQLPLTGIVLNPLASNILDVEFVNELVGFIIMNNSNDGPYKTIDGGVNWTLFSNGITGMCNKTTMYANSETDFFIGGRGCFTSGVIEQYIDPTWGFSTVNYLGPNTSEYIAEIDFKGNIGLAAMNGPYMLRSIDTGANWDTLSVGLQSTDVLTSVMFAANDTVYAGYDSNGGGFGVLISTDAGVTWAQDFNSATFYYPAFLSLGKANNGDVYSGALSSGMSEALMFETSDGVNWLIQPVEQPIYGIASYNSDVTFAVGDSGYVIVNTPLASLGFNTDEDYFYPITIFPNPATDFITIKNEFNESIVFNLVGVNGQAVIANIEATNDKVVDISMLPSGVYYLKSIEKEYNKVHKIIKF